MKLRNNILYILPMILCLCAFALWGVVDEADKKFAKFSGYNIVNAEVIELPKEDVPDNYKVMFTIAETGDKGTVSYVTREHLSLGDNVSIAYHYQDNTLNVEQCMSTYERNFVIGVAIVLLVLAGVILVVQYANRGDKRIYNRQVASRQNKRVKYSETAPIKEILNDSKEETYEAVANVLEDVESEEAEEEVVEEDVEEEDEEDSMFG